jgi:hypothetical protein
MSGSSRPKSPTGSVQGSVRNISTVIEEDTNMGDAGDNSNTSSTKVRIDFFTGNRYKLNAFLVQLKMAFALDDEKFDNETSKTIYAAAYLRGGAFDWFEPYISEWLNKKVGSSETTKAFFRNFSHFETELRTIYGTVDESRAAARDIHNLKQGKGSVAHYYAQFQQHMSKLDWGDSAQHAAFYAGLNDSVKDEFKPAPPKKFELLVAEAIQYDNRQYERKLERKGHHGYERYNPGGRYQKQRQYGGDPMEIDMTNREPSRFKKGGRGGFKGDKERERRRNENLCFNCGKSGHRARDCNASSQPLHMINKEENTGMSGKKADTDMSITWKVGTPRKNTDGGQAQKGIRAPSPAPSTHWEKHQAYVNGLPRKETWGSSDSDHESDDQWEELPWVVIPAKVDAPTTAKKARVIESPNDRNQCEAGAFCMDLRCLGHGKQRDTMAESLRQAEEKRRHDELPWARCNDKGCETHSKGKQVPWGIAHALEKTVTDSQIRRNPPTKNTVENHAKSPWMCCKNGLCPYHRERRWLNEHPEYRVDHATIHWTACTDDQCLTHKPGKDANGWYPKAIQHTLGLAWDHADPEHRNLTIRECRVDEDCPVHDHVTIPRTDGAHEGATINTCANCYWHGRCDRTNEPKRPISRERARPQEPRPDTPITQEIPKWRRTTTVTVTEEERGHNSEEYDASDEEYLLCMINAEEPDPADEYWRDPHCKSCQRILQKEERPFEGPCAECCARGQAEMETHRRDQGPVTSPYSKKETEAPEGPKVKGEPKEDENNSSDDDGDPMTDPYELPEARSHDGVTAPRPYVVTGLTKESFVVVTNKWRYAWCQPSTCSLDAQHTHVLLDTDAKPKDNLRSFHIYVCRNEDCQEKRKHAHYPRHAENVLPLPQAVVQQLELLEQYPDTEDEEADKNLDMIIRHLGTVEGRVDERGNVEYAAEVFDCMDVRCPDFYSNHHHIFNVDPRHPGHALSALEFMRLRKRGCTCADAACEWKENPHVHLQAKNDDGKSS